MSSFNKKVLRTFIVLFSTSTIVGGIALLVFMQKFAINYDTSSTLRLLSVHILGLSLIIFGFFQFLVIFRIEKIYTTLVSPYLYPLVWNKCFTCFLFLYCLLHMPQLVQGWEKCKQPIAWSKGILIRNVLQDRRTWIWNIQNHLYQQRQNTRLHYIRHQHHLW